MGVAEIFYSIATGPVRRRLLLTPVGLALFVILFVLVIAAGLWTDEAFDIPALLPGPLGAAIGVTLLAVGLPLWVWCVVLFAQGGGTPIPLNPPPWSCSGHRSTWSRTWSRSPGSSSPNWNAGSEPPTASTWDRCR